MGFRVKGERFTVWVSKHRVWGLRFRAKSLELGFELHNVRNVGL